MPVLNNFSKFLELREEFPLFCYEAYDYEFNGNSLDIRFSFVLSDDIRFTPEISIPYNRKFFRPYETWQASIMDNLVFHIGMIELVSYWKAACSPEIMVKPHGLGPVQVEFWKKIYFHGLGEFFYLNSIETDETRFVDILSGSGPAVTPFHQEISSASIIPVGGGKDSAVTMGLANKAHADWLPMVINPRGATREVIARAGKKPAEVINIHRSVDPALLRLNGEGFLNGHTPFSALLAFHSLLAGYLSGRPEIILSNESSANEPTIPGTRINHQYSKSFGFEKDFREYYREFIGPGFNYFSLLRPLSEIQIAKIFAGMPEYFDGFKSCNAGSKTDTWCGKCPKCLFTFIILSPFVEPEKLEGIFGKNLLDDLSLAGILDELTGKADIKPFDCIGTTGEVNAALTGTFTRYKGRKLPRLLEYYAGPGNTGTMDGASIEDLLSRFGREHFVPGNYLELLHETLA